MPPPRDGSSWARNRAGLANADLRGANLERASLNGADVRDVANLGSVRLRDAHANVATTWPPGFVPQAAGVIVS